MVCTCGANEDMYDSIIEGIGKERSERQQSGAYHFYNFQNWIKSVLIQVSSLASSLSFCILMVKFFLRGVWL